jgi:Tol biopolymer transport system component
LDEQANGVIAYEAEGDIWVMILPEGIQRQLTTDGSNTKIAFPDGYNRNPVWAPGSLSLAFASPAEASQEPGYQNGYDVFTMRPDGSNRTRLTKSPDSAYVQRLPLGWFSSGELIISQRDTRNPGSSLASLALLEIASGKIKDLPVTQSGISRVAVSPDGKQIAYAATMQDPTTKNTKADLYVVPAAGGQPKALTDLPAGTSQEISALAWSPNGQSLAFAQTAGANCGTYTLYTVTKDGSGLRKLYNAGGYLHTLSYSLSGAWLTYSATNCTSGPTLQLLNIQKPGPPVELGSGKNPSYGKRIVA